MHEVIKKYTIPIQVGTLITVALFLIGSTITIVNAKRDVDSRIDKAEILINGYKEEKKDCNIVHKKLEDGLKKVEEDNQNQDLVIVEIRTKLNNIEAILLNINQKLN